MHGISFSCRIDFITHMFPVLTNLCPPETQVAFLVSRSKLAFAVKKEANKERS